MQIKLSPLLIPFAAAAVWTHTAAQLAPAYACVTAHELAHLVAALCIGLRADTITLSPFGAHLTLKNKIVRSLADEIILYAAGPLLNGILAVVSAYMRNSELYKINIALMAMNLLPIAPLDGGIILKRIIAYNAGMRISERVCATISITAGIIFLSGAIYGLYIGQINLSMFIMAIFLFGSAAMGKELYNVDFINGISGRKRSNKAKLVVIRDSGDMITAIKQISPAYTTIAVTKEKNGEIRLMDEYEMLNESGR